jgi:uncharacterized GH25 family protein
MLARMMPSHRHRLVARGALALALALTLAAMPAPALAHDFWLVPSELVVPGDRDVAISLFVGEDFVAESEKSFERPRFPRVAHLHAGKTADLRGAAVDGAAPILRAPIRGAGGHLIAIDRSPTNITLEPAKFEAYLEHEGLGAVSKERARLGESQKPGRERYSRHLKALVQVGGTRDATYGTIVGQALELVPEAHPVFVEPGGVLPVAVRFRGKPVVGAKLEAFSRSGADIRGASYTTDAAGKVRVAIDRRGVWLLRLTHMVRCTGCADADWESFWTSYTFASANPSGSAVAAPSMLAPKPPGSWLSELADMVQRSQGTPAGKAP